MNPLRIFLCLLPLSVSMALAQPACSGLRPLNIIGPTGCEQADTLFTNFALLNNNGPDANEINTLFTGISEQSGISLTFLSNDWTTLNLGRPDSLTSTINFTVQLDPAFAPPEPSTYWSITGLSLFPFGAIASIGGRATNYVKVFEYFCAGSASFDCNSTSGNYGYLEYELDGGPGLIGLPTDTSRICFNNGGSSCAVTTGSLSLNLATFANSIYPHGVSQFAIQNVVSLNSPRLLNTADLGLFTDTFSQSAQVPEPLTLTCAGIALTGIAVLLRRRRRN